MIDTRQGCLILIYFFVTWSSFLDQTILSRQKAKQMNKSQFSSYFKHQMSLQRCSQTLDSTVRRLSFTLVTSQKTEDNHGSTRCSCQRRSVVPEASVVKFQACLFSTDRHLYNSREHVEQYDMHPFILSTQQSYEHCSIFVQFEK